MDTKMRQTIAGHLAGEYRGNRAGVDDLRWSRDRRDEGKRVSRFDYPRWNVNRRDGVGADSILRCGKQKSFKDGPRA